MLRPQCGCPHSHDVTCLGIRHGLEPEDVHDGDACKCSCHDRDEDGRSEWERLSKLKHGEMVRLAARWLQRSRRCALVLTEYKTHMTREQPDAIGWTPDGSSHLIECKTSRADFFSDAKKDWRYPGQGVGERRYFLCPLGLVSTGEVPEGWGLIIVRDSGCRLIKQAQKRKVFDEKQEKLLLLNAARRATNYTVEPFVANAVQRER